MKTMQTLNRKDQGTVRPASLLRKTLKKQLKVTGKTKLDNNWYFGRNFESQLE